MYVTLEKNFEYFIRENFEKYSDGEWVAIYRNKVISHGDALKEVMQKAKEAAPLSKVLFSKVKKTASYL